MQCEKCGKQLMDDATFCTSCGWKTDNWKHEVKRTKAMHIGAIVALILMLAILAFLLIHILKITDF